MYEIAYYAHLVSAIALLIYLVVPAITLTIKDGGKGDVAKAKPMHLLNRIGQYVLVLAFLTGGYMVSDAGFSTAWMVVIIVLILVMFATTGMLGGPLKRIKLGNGTAKDAKKAKMFSIISAITFIVIVILMYYPEIL